MLGPRPKGIARYIWELCKALDKVLPDARFFVYSPRPIVPMPAISPRWSWRCDLSPVGARIPNSIWGVSRLGYISKRDNLDVFWGGTGLLPLAGLRAPTVLTVHDFVYKLAPETASYRARWAMRMFFGASIRRADQIVSNSFGTARRLEAAYPKTVNAIVRPGLSAIFRPRAGAELRMLLQRYGIAQPYLLSVGTLEPRKGLHRLVPAFSSLLKEGRLKNHCLVLAGERGWKDNSIAQLLKSSARIHPLGFVDDDVLPALYTGADAFVFPSSYEGFGMPVLEALACGTRVVTTDIPELREAGGRDAIYVPPTVEGIRDGIVRALRADRPKPLDNGDYSWLHSAKILANVLSGQTAACLPEPAKYCPDTRVEIRPIDA
jgi:glycosyltransferase involved in cell wall biosynthesis